MTASLGLPAVSAGPPLPISDTQCQHFDVEKYVLQHPRTSFYIEVNGDSLNDRGIHDGDILVIDKAIEPHQGSVVVAQHLGGYTIKVYDLRAGRLRLVPANPLNSALEPSEDTSLCGVATFVIRRL